VSSRSWKQFVNKVGLGGKQRELYFQFIDFHEEIGKELGNIYLGAIRAISDSSNPDRFAQAAHSCRELMSVFKIKVFGREKYSIKKQDVETILKTSDPLQSPPKETVDSLYKSWKKLYSYFSKIAHHEEKPNSAEFSKNFEELEETFLILTKPSVDLFKEIDEILNKKPSKKVVKEALRKLKNAVLADYFYDKVDPSWLKFLEEEGVFKHPPLPIIEYNTVRFPPWPQTKLLLKAIKTEPERVMEIIESCQFPEDKKNWNIYVLIDFVEIALKMPSKIGKRIVDLIKKKQKWLMCPYAFNLLADKLSDLMVKFANENEAEKSLKLAKILLDVTTIEEKKSKTLIEVKSYISTWNYKQILEKKIPVILRVEPLKTIEVLASRLKDAISLENKVKNIKVNNIDYSDIWRPAIEDNPQNWKHENIKNYLVVGLRNSLEEIGRSNEKLIKDAISFLDKFKYSIFKRIQLHIFRLFPDLFEKEIHNAVKQYFDDIALWHEYQLLISQEFCSFPKELKKWYLEQIENISKKGKDKTYIETQQLRRLLLIKNCLDGEWEKKFKELVKKYKEIKHPEFLFYISWVESTSPLPLEKLEKLFKNEGIEEIINYLKELDTKNQGFEELSFEKLGMNLEELIEKYPKEFSEKSLIFWREKVRLVYIYHLFSGLREAIRKNKEINWNEVIKLMVEITLNYKKQDILEPDWNSVIGAEIRLLNEGFFNSYPIPFKEKENVWKIIEKLSEHPEPDLKYEEKYGGDNMNPATMSINTIRGEAIHGVINYALWCSKNLNKKILVEEVKKVLEEHLHIEKEKTLTVRSVYGWRLPDLVDLDKNWVEKNLDKIFPNEKSLESFWLSAFEAYLFNSVDSDIFKLLEKEYIKAISYLNSTESKKKLFVNINERLPEYLIIAYVYNVYDNKIIDQFFSQAPISAKTRAFDFIGGVIFSEENLKKNKGKINFERIQLLLEERLKNKEKEELKKFGWWFVNSPFKKKWNIKKLYEILQVTNGEIEGAHQVIEKLKEYVKSSPLLVVKSLFLIIEGNKKSWEVYYKKEELKGIISVLLSKGKNVGKEAKKLINMLVERGFLEFKELLS